VIAAAIAALSSIVVLIGGFGADASVPFVEGTEATLNLALPEERVEILDASYAVETSRARVSSYGLNGSGRKRISFNREVAFTARVYDPILSELFPSVREFKIGRQRKGRDESLRPNTHLGRRGNAVVSKAHTERRVAAERVRMRPLMGRDRNVGPELLLGRLTGDGDDFGSRLSSGPGVEQRPPNQEDADAANHRRERSGEEHPLRPQRHALLGVQIAGSALLALCGFGACLRGFQIAGDALETVLDRGRGGAVRLSLGAILAFGGAALPAALLTYWIGTLGGAQPQRHNNRTYREYHPPHGGDLDA
jgi:hypothetical protein